MNKLDHRISKLIEDGRSGKPYGERMNKFYVESDNATSMIIDEMKYRWMNESVEFYQQSYNFCKDTGFDPIKFAENFGYKISQSCDRYGGVESLLFREDVVIKLSQESKKIQAVAFSKREEHDSIKTQLFSVLTPIGPMIEWVTNERGDTVSVPLQTKPLIKSAYPWIEGDVMDYIHDYYQSDASILILIGPPGTGKTSLIRSMIEHSGSSGMVTYDERCMNGDSLFSQFIEGSAGTIVFEDADNFLQPRKDGNSMMHRFLNVGDGLISSRGKKMIFSTNLPNVSDIDSSLTRCGRAFDILNFRHLSIDESKKVILEVGIEKDLSSKSSWSLAELTNEIRSHGKLTRRVGFY